MYYKNENGIKRITHKNSVTEHFQDTKKSNTDTVYIMIGIAVFILIALGLFFYFKSKRTQPLNLGLGQSNVQKYGNYKIPSQKNVTGLEF
jgi:hypothetical protein